MAATAIKGLRVIHMVLSNFTIEQTSIDVLPSKNQALYEYCTHVSKLKYC